MNNNDKEYIVYGLKDPSTKEIKYVGLSTNIDSRYKLHISQSKTNQPKSDKDNWICTLLNNGLKPELITLKKFVCDNRIEAQNMETKWIKEYPNCFNKNQTDKIMNRRITIRVTEEEYEQFLSVVDNDISYSFREAIFEYINKNKT
jgi:hypothetical protein